MTRSIKLTLTTTAALILLATTATYAIFTNGSFEAGDFSGGWVRSAFWNLNGLSGSEPFSGSNIGGIPGADTARTTVVGPAATPLSLSDPIVAAVQYPRFGAYAARVNYWPNGGSPNYVANSLRQQSVVGAGDIDPSDGKVHARFVYLPVLEDGGHPQADQAYFYVAVRNLTKGTVVWERFAFANDAGAPWSSSGAFRYTGWQAADASGGPGVIDIGDTLELEVIASSCAQSGHRGHVYVDAFGSNIPGGSIVATAPSSTVPNASLTYDMHVANGGTTPLASPVVSVTIPSQTTFASVTNPACSHASGVLTCNLPDLAPGATVDFDLVVTVAGSASGTITLGNYSIAGTGYPALLGPARSTTVNSPVAAPDSYTTNRNVALVVATPGILTNDTDPNGDALTAVLATGPAHGTLTLNANGSFTYTPASGYTGPDSFIYRARDATNNLSASTNVVLSVTLPGTPTANPDAYSTNEDAPLTVNAAGVLANDTDPTAQPLTAELVTGPSQGTLTLDGNGSFVYTPHAEYSGTDAFSYRATDGSLTSSVVTVSLTITTVDDVPTAVNDVYPVAEDTPITVLAPGVLGNDADVDSATLTAILVSPPANGSVAFNPDGSFNYTPNANFAGPDVFTYRVSDGTSQSNIASVSLMVSAASDAPTAGTDAYTIAEDTLLTVPATGVLGNDADPDAGTTLSAVLVSQPAHGVLTLNADGSFAYQPAANYSGPDSFVYRASDGTLQSGDTSVTLTVTAVADPPTAGTDGYTIDEDTLLTVPAPGVLGNDSDPDAATTLSAVLVSQPAHGVLTLNADGSFTYQPTANYSGPDSFVYRASDGTLQSGDTSVTLTVTAVADPPTAGTDGFTIDEDTLLTVSAPGVLGNDADPDAGTTLSAVLVSQPAHGVLTLNADGSFAYQPAANYNGPDSFVYRASDGTLQSGDTSVTLTVTAVADPPTAGTDGYTIDEDTLLTVSAPGVLGNDSDPDAATTLSAVLVSQPAHGVLTLNADGSFTYQPTANYSGPDSFVYRASDGTLQSGDTSVTLDVTPVADPPTAGTDAYTIDEDTLLTVPAPGVLGNDSDPDATTPSAVLVSQPAHGVLTLNADGSFTYQPNANYSGPDSFVYRASDGTLQSGDTSVTLTVTALEDPPTAGTDGYTVAEDTVLTVPVPGVLGNDVDLDGDPLTATLVSGPAHGTLTFNVDGSFVYTPDANYSGPDSFTYTVNDGDQTSTPATVTLTVSPVNDLPTAVADTYSLGEDQTLSVPASSGLLANDSDLDPSSVLTAVLVTGPAHGTLTLNPDGGFTYVPDPNFNGVDTFTYHVNDGTAASMAVTVTMNVGDDVTLSPGAGRATGGTRVTIEGTGFGPAGTPVTVTIGGVPGLEAEVLDDGHITFVTPALPPGTPVDVVFVVNNGPPETLPGAYMPLPVPAAGDPTDTDGDGITDEIELKYGLDPTNPADAGNDPDHDGIPSNTEIINGTHPNAPYLRFFAEGINNTVFNTGIAVANASAATMEVQLTFFRQGEAPVRKNLTLTGRTRLMLNSATVPGMANAAFGVEIAGNEAVSADRTTFWDLGGREAHSERAVEASPTWYFAEGATTGRFSLFYLLTNPSSQPANATVTFLRQVGAPIVKQMVVPGYARVTIPVGAADPGLVSADVGGIVSADRPIVVERSMYLSSPSKIWEAGTGGTGVTAPATRWFFGEGATGSFFDAWILLSNPGSTDATVDVRYVADTGADVTRRHTVPAGRRITIRVVDEDAAMMNTSFATFVTSTNAVPVVAERAMWWRSNEGRWTAGHVGVGFTEGGKKWVTADGVAAADGSSDTYALVSNTENRAGMLKVTAVFGDGTAPIERLFAIGPNQRFTIRGRQRFPEVVGKGYSFIIESIGAVPVDIVVDHSTYFDMDGRSWAIGTTSPGSKIR